MAYTSSIVDKYGDTANVLRDARTLQEILSRQGSGLLIDAIAEYAGKTANDFRFPESVRVKLVQDFVTDFENALKERL